MGDWWIVVAVLMATVVLIVFGMWCDGGLSTPKFCRTCGRRLVKDTLQVGFDRRSGKPIVRSWLHCPGLTRPWGWDDLDCVPPPPED